MFAHPRFIKVHFNHSINAFLLQIWDLVDTSQGFMTRNGLYKALALTALAQQGKTVSDKLLESYGTQGN